MARRPTVILKRGDTYFKIFKVWFGSDGSYYVTLPYHSSSKAMLCKITVNYDVGTTQFVSMEDVPELAALDDDGQRLKLSHHPDGFCQFSGQGVMSGKDENGMPKGIGIFAAPLADVGGGPAFAVGVNGLDYFDQTAEPKTTDLVIDTERVFGRSDDCDYVIEGHYFQPKLRRFIFTENGQQYIETPHPWGKVLRLLVMLGDADADYPGFIGLDCFRIKMDLPEPGFTLSGPAEKSRENDKGEKIADMISCMYPRPLERNDAPNVNFPMRGTT